MRRSAPRRPSINMINPLTPNQLAELTGDLEVDMSFDESGFGMSPILRGRMTVGDKVAAVITEPLPYGNNPAFWVHGLNRSGRPIERVVNGLQPQILGLNIPGCTATQNNDFWRILRAGDGVSAGTAMPMGPGSAEAAAYAAVQNWAGNIALYKYFLGCETEPSRDPERFILGNVLYNLWFQELGDHEHRPIHCFDQIPALTEIPKRTR